MHAEGLMVPSDVVACGHVCVCVRDYGRRMDADPGSNVA